MSGPRIAVVGAGIAGLAAAWEAQLRGSDVVVFESSDRLGGKLRTSAVPGVDFPVDEGADAFLARVPDALELCDELEMDELVHPAQRRAQVYARGALRPLPAAHVLGVPTDLDDVARTGLLSDDGLAELRRLSGVSFEAPSQDVSIAGLVNERLGAEATTNLVEPLLGGINAGEAAELSLAAVAPQIWALAQQGGSLVDAAIALRAGIDSSAPVFSAPAGGMAELVDALARRLIAHERTDVRTGVAVESIETVGGGVRVNGEDFAGVVVATPAQVSARVLANAVPDAAAALAETELASVIMVTLVFDATLDHPLDGSGFVVARNSDVDITAVSWGSSKWDRWDDGDHALLRVSLGHDADPIDWCGRDDADITGVVRADLATTMGVDALPVGVRITRWRDAFAQYRPGHLERVADIDAAAADAGPIRLASSALGGIGIPACIRQGRNAVRSLL